MVVVITQSKAYLAWLEAPLSQLRVLTTVPCKPTETDLSQCDDYRHIFFVCLDFMPALCHR